MTQNWGPPIPPEDSNLPPEQGNIPPHDPTSQQGWQPPYANPQQNILQQREEQYQQYQQQYQQGYYGGMVANHFTWQEVFQMVLFNPSPENFERLVNDPEAGFNRAVKWIAVAYSIVFALFLVLLFCFGTLSATSSSTAGTGDIAGLFGGSILCVGIMLPVAIVIAIIGGMIGVGLIHLPALIFGGEGEFEKLFYVLVAVYIPLTTISSLIGIIPILGQLVSIIIYLYMSVLMVMAVKGIHKIGWLGAVVSVYWLYVLVFLCYAAYFATLFGGFSSMQTTP